jgi:hypothetical protein
MLPAVAFSVCSRLPDPSTSFGALWTKQTDLRGSGPDQTFRESLLFSEFSIYSRPFLFIHLLSPSLPLPPPCPLPPLALLSLFGLPKARCRWSLVRATSFHFQDDTQGLGMSYFSSQTNVTSKIGSLRREDDNHWVYSNRTWDPFK